MWINELVSTSKRVEQVEQWNIQSKNNNLHCSTSKKAKWNKWNRWNGATEQGLSLDVFSSTQADSVPLVPLQKMEMEQKIKTQGIDITSGVPEFHLFHHEKDTKHIDEAEGDEAEGDEAGGDGAEAFSQVIAQSERPLFVDGNGNGLRCLKCRYSRTQYIPEEQRERHQKQRSQAGQSIWHGLCTLDTAGALSLEGSHSRCGMHPFGDDESIVVQ